jgi:hypothetical protein
MMMRHDSTASGFSDAKGADTDSVYSAPNYIRTKGSERDFGLKGLRQEQNSIDMKSENSDLKCSSLHSMMMDPITNGLLHPNGMRRGGDEDENPNFYSDNEERKQEVADLDKNERMLDELNLPFDGNCKVALSMI